mgnify:CR=1 FL=1
MGETPIEVDARHRRDLADPQLLHTACRTRCTCTASTFEVLERETSRPIRSRRSQVDDRGRLATRSRPQGHGARLAGRERAASRSTSRMPFAGRADVHVPLPQPRARGRRNDGGRPRRDAPRCSPAAVTRTSKLLAICAAPAADGRVRSSRRAPILAAYSGMVPASSRAGTQSQTRRSTSVAPAQPRARV